MKSPESNLPYVVSSDVSGLFRTWAGLQGYSIPSSQYFADFSDELQQQLAEATGAPVEVIEETELREGLLERTEACSFPVFSLDRAYIDASSGVQGFIDMTRAVDTNFNDIGIRARPDRPPVDEQLEALRTDEESPIALLDDVIFSGDGIVSIAAKLKALNRPVVQIISGIAIGKGVSKLETANIEVKCVRAYDEVYDEVCERDFLAGVPMSGRTVICGDGNYWSAPYFEPFGNVAQWASIPSSVTAQFSQFCLEQSIALWDEVERYSGCEIAANLVPRRIQRIDSADSIVRALQRQRTVNVSLN